MKTLLSIFLLFLSLGISNAQIFDTAKLCNRIEEKALRADFYSALARVKYTDNKQDVGLDANILIRTDSAIWVSVSAALNIEVARILLTPDSVRMINKLQNTWSSFSYSALKSILGMEVNFAHIQAFFYNNMFIYPDNKITTENLAGYKIVESPIEIEISKGDSLVNDAGLISSYKIQNKLFKPIFMQIKDVVRKREFTVNYGKSRKFSKLVYPSEFNINTLSEKNKVNINLQFSKVQINKPKRISFNINSKYKKVDLFKVEQK